jgi:hypothetical protein
MGTEPEGEFGVHPIARSGFTAIAQVLRQKLGSSVGQNHYEGNKEIWRISPSCVDMIIFSTCTGPNDHFF